MGTPLPYHTHIFKTALHPLLSARVTLNILRPTPKVIDIYIKPVHSSVSYQWAITQKYSRCGRESPSGYGPLALVTIRTMLPYMRFPYFFILFLMFRAIDYWKGSPISCQMSIFIEQTCRLSLTCILHCHMNRLLCYHISLIIPHIMFLIIFLVCVGSMSLTELKK